KVPEPRESGRAPLAEALGERLRFRVARALERQYRDPKSRLVSDLPRVASDGGSSRRGRRQLRGDRRGLRLQVAQFGENIARGLVAVVRVLREAAAEDPSDMRGEVRADLGDRERVVPQDRRDDVDGAPTLERTLTGQHFIEDDAERE